MSGVELGGTSLPSRGSASEEVEDEPFDPVRSLRSESDTGPGTQGQETIAICSARFCFGIRSNT